MERLKKWWKSWSDRSNEEYKSRVRKHSEREARRDVQPIVWNGKVWLSYCGIPIVEADDMKNGLLESVEEAQRTVAEYNAERLNE